MAAVNRDPDCTSRSNKHAQFEVAEHLSNRPLAIGFGLTAVLQKPFDFVGAVVDGDLLYAVVQPGRIPAVF